MCLISKKQLCGLFLCRCFARLQLETSRNLLHVYGGNVVHALVHFFRCRSFFASGPLAFLIFSPPLQIHVVLPTKNGSLSLTFALHQPRPQGAFPWGRGWLSIALFLVDLRWPVAYFLFFAVFLFLYIPNLST